MPIINAQILQGRSPEQTRAYISALSQATTSTLGVPAEAVRIVLTEVSPEHWGVGPISMAELRNKGASQVKSPQPTT